MIPSPSINAYNPLNVRPSGVSQLHQLLEQRLRWRTWEEIYQSLHAANAETTLSGHCVAIGHHALAQMTRGFLNICIGPAVGSSLTDAIGQVRIALPNRRLLIADLVQEYAQFLPYSDAAACVDITLPNPLASASRHSLHVGPRLPMRTTPLRTLMLASAGTKLSPHPPDTNILLEGYGDSIFESPMWVWMSNIWNERWDTLPGHNQFNIMIYQQFTHPQFQGNFNIFHGTTVGSDILQADGLVIVELPESRLFIADLIAEKAEFMAYSDEAAMVAPQYREYLS